MPKPPMKQGNPAYGRLTMSGVLDSASRNAGTRPAAPTRFGSSKSGVIV